MLDERVFTMIKTDEKLSKACKQADKQASVTGKRYIVSMSGRGGYIVEQKTKPFFGWAVVYATL